MTTRRILILDEIEARPGKAGEVRAAYARDYKPGAQARGMTLEAAWQHPPMIDVPELPATLFYLWSVNGEAGWWRQRLSRKADGSDERADKERFWQGITPLTLGRKRRMLSEMPADAAGED